MSKNNAKILHEFCTKFKDPENLLRLGVRVSHFSLPGPPSEQYQCTPRNSLIALNCNFFFQEVFYVTVYIN